jgi:hypothetical protein
MLQPALQRRMSQVSEGLVHTRGAKVLLLPHLVSNWDKANYARCMAQLSFSRRTDQPTIPVLPEPYFFFFLLVVIVEGFRVLAAVL